MPVQTMLDVTMNGTRLDQLRALAQVLAKSIDEGDENHSMAQITRQYRETIAEISVLEEMQDDGDELGEILG